MKRQVERALMFAMMVVAVAGRAEMKRLTVVVLPETVPVGDSLYLTGNQEDLGNWNPGVYALTPTGDGRYEGYLAFPAGTEVAFKVTRGSWETEAVAADGAVPEDHVVSLTEDTTVEVAVPQWKDMSASDGITGEVRYHEAVGGHGAPERRVVVWLPPGYEDSGERYPVLYMHDGQNVFDPRTSFTGVDWGVDEAADRMIREGTLRPCIVVGMANTSIRHAEYGADPEATRAYMDYVIHTVKPMIDATYRTRPGREDTVVMGSSMGGCISWLLAWHHPEVFAGAGCLSPAFMFGNILPDLAAHEGEPKNLRLYLDNGGVGMDRERMQPVLDELLPLLDDKGASLGIQYSWKLYPDAEHNEAAWAARVQEPLGYLLGTAP